MSVTAGRVGGETMPHFAARVLTQTTPGWLVSDYGQIGRLVSPFCR
jgi:hypothetical protein